MASALGNGTSFWYSIDSAYEIHPTVNFWLFLAFDVSAILCTIFVLYHLLGKRQLRNSLHNHIPIIMLLLAFAYQLIDIPMHLDFYRAGVVPLKAPIVCLIWWFIDWGFYYMITVLLVLASFERHILIFHSQVMATRRGRLIAHYLPILTILVLMSTFYGVAIFGSVCESTFDYTSALCGAHSCYGTLPFFIIVEQLIFGATCTLLIAAFNMALLVRVVRQKHRVHGVVQWRKQRKIAVQMISLSSLYTTFSLPLTTIYVVRLFGEPDWGAQVLPIFFFLSYFVIFFLPFVCLTNLSDLGKILKTCMARSQRRVGVQVPR